MPSAWCDRLLDTHFLAVLSAIGVALVAFPGADLVKSAQAGPPAVVEPAVRKGPVARFTSQPAATPQQPESDSAPNETASEPKRRAPAKPARHPSESREIEGCLATHTESACRRAFDAAVERYASGNARAGDVIVTRAALEPLAFDDDPLWVRRLESLAADGVALKRVRTGSDHEWVFGITRDGVVGFSFEERRGD